jgi:hypothetical protein
VVKLYIIEARIPLRPLDAVSIVIPTVCNEPEQAPDMHPTGKGIGVSTFSAIPPNDGANHGSPLLIPQFWHSGKIAALKHRRHHRYPALENREAKPR